MIDYADRARTMYTMHVKEHRTLTAIGKKFGLSKERVRQIVSKYREEKTDVSDIRTARHGEDNNATEHGGQGS